MRLSPRNAAFYLMARRLITAEQVVSGGLMAIDISRRNRNIKVILQDGAGLFLKQTQGNNPHDVVALSREAACYSLARQHAATASLDQIMPRLCFFDAAANILTMDLIPGGESLYLYHQRIRQFPVAIGDALAASLAKLHRAEVSEALTGGHGFEIFPRTPAWILSTFEMTPALTSAVSPANRQLIDLVQRYAGFGEALAALRSGWSPAALIHGDVKWDNCVLTWPEGIDGTPHVVLVDWELADIGDPSWDVGAVLQGYLSEWVSSIPERADATPAELAGTATMPLESVQPAIRAFWDRYVQDREIPPRERGALLDRCVRSAGARMIQTAYESLAYAESLTPRMVLLLQMSLNVLTRPGEAAKQLLALT